MRLKISTLIFVLVSSYLLETNAIPLERNDVKAFVEEMTKKHGFKPAYLNGIFERIKFNDSVIKAISRPAEALPWYKYRPIFLKQDRINLGVKFWQENQDILEKAEQEYGVPVELIIAIIGVETRFGRNAGNYTVVNSLATLAFNYPKRSSFFTRELEQFLLLTREQDVDPFEIKGSYAGAMGIPQFISSSYRSYAIDFNNDGKTDIWNDTTDAIGSVANYFKVHGWKKGEPITRPVNIEGQKYKNVLSEGLKPAYTVEEMSQHGVMINKDDGMDRMAKLLELENLNGNEYWLCYDNFYVVTRYNHSALYAMAVYQLSVDIRTQYLLTSNQ